MTVGGLVGGANILNVLAGGKNTALYVGVIDGESITRREFEYERQIQINRIVQQGGTVNEQAAINAGNSAWNTIIESYIKEQKIKEMNLTVFSDEVYDFLVQTPPPIFKTNITDAGFFTDDNGNFGNPINLGSKINSKANEISPFYHQEKGQLYFSSDRKNGMGGFDIYVSKGGLTLWQSPTLLSPPLNTVHDEMYLNFCTKNTGYFSSNRSPAIFKDGENCCNDIFSFEFIQYEPDSTKIIDKINNYLPLSLYFHNDEPDCCTMDPITNLTYKESYISYFFLKEEYIKQNKSPDKIQGFFDDRLKENFNKLDQLLLKIKSALAQGQKIELEIKGFASPLFEADYNINLSKRRIVSLLNYMEEFQNGSITQYLKNEQLVIHELPLGEAKSVNRVNDNPKNKKLSVYSLEAVLARKIEIVRVKLKQ